MSTDKNVQTVKDFFAAIGRGDREALLALVVEDIEWIIPGKDWPLAGTRHGHAGLADLLETAFKSMETSTEPRACSRTRTMRTRSRCLIPRSRARLIASPIGS
jgi:ketosteroid isomerase-like protein